MPEQVNRTLYQGGKLILTEDLEVELDINTLTVKGKMAVDIPTELDQSTNKQYVDYKIGRYVPQYQYDWDTNVVSSDPGTGKAKCNAADPSLATEVYISVRDKTDIAIIGVTKLLVGDRFGFYRANAITSYIEFDIVEPIINTANLWFIIPCAATDHNLFTPGPNENLIFIL